MRRTLLAVAVAAALLLAYAPVQADDFVYARFSDYVEALRVQAGIPGLAVSIVGLTDVLWERGFGYQDVEHGLAMRPDTPAPLDALTQVFTATYMLGCAERGQLSLDDAIGAYVSDAPEPAATFRQLLSHTSLSTTGLSFLYQPSRLDALAGVIRRCEGATYRSTTALAIDRLAMVNSVPGADVLTVLPPPDPKDPTSESSRYAAILQRLETPYVVDGSHRATPTRFAPSTLLPSTGLISTAHDYAQFDLALRGGVLLTPDSLADAWRQPADATGRLLPHGLGWFVQTYGADKVVWQFGTAADAGSSSLVITLPARGVTLVMVANSTGLVKSFPLDKGDVTVSPFARVFFALFAK
jgi:CubicO group peptidase (beta-lactamase class C family)